LVLIWFFSALDFRTKFQEVKIFILRKFHFAKKSSSLTKIERNQGYFFRKSDFILRKARLEISKSRIEKIKSRIKNSKSRFFLKKTAKKSQKTKTFLAKIGLKKVKGLIYCFLVKGL
jgi:hypothetical protein